MAANLVTSIDLERARRETPGCTRVLHFNNAGASLLPTPVLDAVRAYQDLEALNGGYEVEAREQSAIEHVYDAAAAMFGCGANEIAVVESATRAWDMAFYAIPFRPGDRLLVSRAEYASNYIALLQVAARTGVQVGVIPSDDTGQVDLDALRHMIDGRVRLIAITHVPTNGGLVNPATAIGQIAHDAGALYLLDACQSIGQMPLDVDTLGCDFLSATGRKFLRAPRGTGLLYVRRRVLDRLEPPFLDDHAATWIASDRYEMRPDARRFESFESNRAAKIGLGVALDYALGWGLDAIYARVTALADDLRARLATLPGVTVHDLGRERCGIVTFSVENRAPDAIKTALAAQNVNVWVTRAPSALLDMQARGLTELVRASVHYYNSEAEIARFCAILSTIIATSVEGS